MGATGRISYCKCATISSASLLQRIAHLSASTSSALFAYPHVVSVPSRIDECSLLQTEQHILRMCTVLQAFAKQKMNALSSNVRTEPSMSHMTYVWCISDTAIEAVKHRT